MTSLAPLGSPGISPRARVDARIADAVDAGRISRVDQGALTTALDHIDASIGKNAPAAGGSVAGGSVKDRIDDLIAAQVASGALTDRQAGDLQQFFGAGSAGDDGGTVGATEAAAPPRRTAMDDQLQQLTMLVDKMRRNMAPAVTYGSSGYGKGSGYGGPAQSGLIIDGTA